MLGTIVTGLLDGLYRELDRSLNIVETGTAFQNWLEPGEKDLGERSTVAIARWIAKNPGHKFYSLDLNMAHIHTAQDMLALENLMDIPSFWQGDSVQSLKNIPHPFDFVLLDSDSGPETPFEEFKYVRENMAFNGIIVVDDAFKPPHVNKASYILQEVNRACGLWFALRKQAVGIPFGPLAQHVLAEFAKG